MTAADIWGAIGAIALLGLVWIIDGLFTKDRCDR